MEKVIKRITPVLLAFCILLMSVPVFADDQYGNEIGYASFVISSSRTISYKFFYNNIYEEYMPVLLMGNNNSAGGTMLLKQDGKWIKSGIVNTYYSVTDFGNERFYSIKDTSSKIQLNPDSFISYESNMYIISVNDNLVWGNSWGGQYLNNFVDYLNGDAELDSKIELPKPEDPTEYDGTTINYLDIGWFDSFMYNLFGEWYYSATTTFDEYADARFVYESKDYEEHWQTYLHADGSEEPRYIPYRQYLINFNNGYRAGTGAVSTLFGFFGGEYSLEIKDNDYVKYALKRLDGTVEETEIADIDGTSDVTIYERPVVYDREKRIYISGNWSGYNPTGTTVINRYYVTENNGITYNTDVQTQTSYNFSYDPPVASGPFTDTNFPIVDNKPTPGSDVASSIIYNYYTIYNNTTGDTENVQNIVNKYFSYPARDLEPDPDVDQILEGVTPANFFGFLKKLLKYVIKLFNMFAGCLSFLPLWAQIVVKAVVPIFGIVIIGIIIIKGVL